jgi:hypothetical protein
VSVCCNTVLYIKLLYRKCSVVAAGMVFNCVAVSVECERNGRLHHQESEELQDTRNLRDEDLRNLAQVYIIFTHYTVRLNFFDIFM